jgi:hypothetical protein
MLAVAACTIALALNNSVRAKNVLDYKILSGDQVRDALLLTDSKLEILDTHIPTIPHMLGSLKLRFSDTIRARSLKSLLAPKQIRVHEPVLRDGLSNINSDNLLKRVGIDQGHLKDIVRIAGTLSVAQLDGRTVLTTLTGDLL